jgi:hypothetical protein
MSTNAGIEAAFASEWVRNERKVCLLSEPHSDQRQDTRIVETKSWLASPFTRR